MGHPDEGNVMWNNQSIYDWDVTRRSLWRGASVGFVFSVIQPYSIFNRVRKCGVGLSLATMGQKIRV